MVGPAVGGILAEHAGLGAPFAVIAGAAAIILVPLVAGTAEPAVAAPGTPPAPEDLPLDVAYAQAPIVDRPGAISPRVLLAVARRPRVSAAAGALIVSGAVSSASQLLISGGMHRLGFSTGRIGLAFSAAAVCYIVVSAVVVRLGRRAHTLRFNALTTAGARVRAPAGPGRRRDAGAGGRPHPHRRTARGDQHDRLLARRRPALRRRR